MEEEKVVAAETVAEEKAPVEAPKEGERRPQGDRRPRGDRKGNPRDRRDRKDVRRDEPKEFEERVVFINRVSKTISTFMITNDH